MAYRTIILGIESSCDDTSAAVIADGVKLSNVTANQSIHEQYGGVVPELAGRAHQKNILPVVDVALKEAGITPNQLTAIGYTRGPGLMGSLLVGGCFAHGLSLGLNIPLIEVNHMQGHVLAHFIREKDTSSNVPQFPFLCLTVSGGHTQILKVNSHFDMEVLGETQDDAAGEAFDKGAKIIGLPYPGGPHIDRLAAKGNPQAFDLPMSKMPGLTFSFSGLKTAFLYLTQKGEKANPNFIEENQADLAASLQAAILKMLLAKLKRASKETRISTIAIAGGVSANRGLRQALEQQAQKSSWELFIPSFEYCTDNAAMIAMTAYLKYESGDFKKGYLPPLARLKL